MATFGMTLIEITNRSKSSKDPKKKPYTTKLTEDGLLGCDCQGWTKFKQRPRTCTHTDDIVDAFGVPTMAKGDYTYVTPEGMQRVSAYCAQNGPGPLRTLPGKGFTGTLPTPNTIDPKFFDPPKVKKPKPAKPAAPKAPMMVGGIRIIDLDGDDELNPYVDPMLAVLMPGLPDQRVKTVLAAIVRYTAALWAMEEKFDGHRIIVAVLDGIVTAWSRPGAGGKDALKRLPGTPGWPQHIVDAFAAMPNGTYDGEVMFPGGTSSDVTDLSKQDELVFVVFDIVRLLGEDTTDYTYDERRTLLTQVFSTQPMSVIITLSESVPPSREFVEAIFARGGEGAILKRRAATYQVGCRSNDIIKVKGLEHALMTVTGFKKGKLGKFASVKVVHDDGTATTVKTLDNDAIRAFESQSDSAFLGKKLWVEYTVRTRDGKFKHPRWDKWEWEAKAGEYR